MTIRAPPYVVLTSVLSLPPSTNLMKFFLAVLTLLVPAVYGQGVEIAAPAANSHVTAAQSVVVEVERPVRPRFNRLPGEILKLLSRTHKLRLRILRSS